MVEAERAVQLHPHDVILGHRDRSRRGAGGILWRHGLPETRVAVVGNAKIDARRGVDVDLDVAVGRKAHADDVADGRLRKELLVGGVQAVKAAGESEGDKAAAAADRVAGDQSDVCPDDVWRFRYCGDVDELARNLRLRVDQTENALRDRGSERRGVERPRGNPPVDLLLRQQEDEVGVVGLIPILVGDRLHRGGQLEPHADTGETPGGTQRHRHGYRCDGIGVGRGEADALVVDLHHEVGRVVQHAAELSVRTGERDLIASSQPRVAGEGKRVARHGTHRHTRVVFEQHGRAGHGTVDGDVDRRGRLG